MGNGRRTGLGGKRTNSGLDRTRWPRSRAWKWSRDRMGGRKFGMLRSEARGGGGRGEMRKVDQAVRGRQRAEAGDARRAPCCPAGRCRGAPRRASTGTRAWGRRALPPELGSAAQVAAASTRAPRSARWGGGEAARARPRAAGARLRPVTSGQGARRAAAGGAGRRALRAAAGGAAGREGRSSAREEAGEERPPGPRAAAGEGAAEPEREQNS